MDVWDEFLLFVYVLPPAIVVGAALVVKLAAKLMGKTLRWVNAFAIGVVTLVVGFAGLATYWILNG